MDKARELIIVGGGPTGLTAALYASRAGVDTLLLEEMMVGGQMGSTYLIENYPGFPEGITGPELGAKMEEQARRFGTEIVADRAQALEVLDEGLKRVVTEQRGYLGRAVVIATGTQPRRLGVVGERELFGRGVSYCATCDGALFREKTLAVVGGGNSAVEEGLFLTRFASKVYLIHRRDRLRAISLLQQRAFANPKMELIWNSVVTQVNGQERVSSVTLENLQTGERRELPTDGIFVYIGLRPNTGFLEGVVARDEDGFVIADSMMRTRIPGVFAAGDVRSGAVRQIVIAAGEGALAANSVQKYLEGLPVTDAV